MRILGIDPGIRNTGWGVVEQSDNRLRHIANGVIRPKPNLADAARLHFIAVGVAEAIAAHRPDAAAIEEIFVAKSATSALKLGMARGVAMMQCGEASLPLMEISARRVKNQSLALAPPTRGKCRTWSNDCLASGPPMPMRRCARHSDRRRSRYSPLWS